MRIVFAALALGLPAGADGERPEPVHRDPVALERAAGDAIAGYARDDARRVERALDIVAEQVRVMRVEEQAVYGNAVGYSRSFEISNNLAREYANGDMLDESYDQYVWVMKGCRTCHTIVIKEGLVVHSDREEPDTP